MLYTQVTFNFPEIESYQQDLLIAELADTGFDTFEERDHGFAAFIASDVFDVEKLNHTLKAFDDQLKYDYVVEEIADQNWNEEWEKNFEPLIINDRCYIRATFHEAQPQYEYEIVIDPKMAFGTGHHQTTTMMMQYILSADLKDQILLDMGCGTGILTILASKRGAKELIAIDNDEVCYHSVIENTQLNKVQNVTAICGGKEAIPDLVFDSILANINRNILLDQISEYAGVLKNGGSIYLSGFYESPDLDMIKNECLLYGIHYHGHYKTDDWVAAHFIKNS